jgi:hypothetical protein
VPTRGITTHNCTMPSSKDFFATAAITQVKFQPQLIGVTLSAQNSPSDRMFCSSGLNLAFEGLLLGVSLRCHTKGTDNDPHESSPKYAEGVHDALDHSEGTLLYFCRKAEVSEVPGRSSHADTTEGREPEAEYRRLGGGAEGRASLAGRRSPREHPHVAASCWSA